MLKIWKVILTLSIAANILLGYFLYSRSVPELEYNEYTDRIDSLNLVLDSLEEQRYLIREKIDTVFINIEKTNIVYEKERTRILNSSVDDNMCFFQEYIRRNKPRFDSINNF